MVEGEAGALAALLEFMSGENVVVFGTGIGAALGGAFMAFRALRTGKPSAPAVAEVEAVKCHAADLTPRLEAIEDKMERAEVRDARMDATQQFMQSALMRLLERSGGQ